MPHPKIAFLGHNISRFFWAESVHWKVYPTEQEKTILAADHPLPN
jgi:hypothetical protein